MAFEIISKPKIQLFGLSAELTKSQKKNFLIIRNHWQKFNHELKSRKLNQGSEWKKYAITYKISDKYYYLTAIPLKNEITGFDSIDIPEGKYAIFQHFGDMNLISKTFFNIYKKIIPESNIKLNLDRTFLHYEYYDNRFKWNNTDSIIDIYVPVEN